jgi:hypothetical protein
MSMPPKSASKADHLKTAHHHLSEAHKHLSAHSSGGRKAGEHKGGEKAAHSERRKKDGEFGGDRKRPAPRKKSEPRR